MKFPVPWIAQFVDLPSDEEAVASAFTFSGSEVEGRDAVEGETVFDFNLTVNRPDCMNALGLAREAACLFNKLLKPPETACAESGPPVESLSSVTVEAPDLCPRYGARVITGVRVGVSPDWLRKRLVQCGLRPVNAVVDITNFVLLEMGHPLHAFDLDRLEGRAIVVRRARQGEKMLFLDGMERPLDPGHLVIADALRPVALAGVMGGEETGVTAATKDILLEGALFDPVSVRRTSKSLGLRTDASHRFERGVDAEGPRYALDRCARLVLEICGGTLAQGAWDVGEPLRARPAIHLRSALVHRLLGIDIPKARCESILAGLGFEVRPDGPDGWWITAPSHRVDIAREADLVEEIMRIHGLQDLPAVLPGMVDPVGGRPADLTLEELLRDSLAAAGFREAIHMSMAAPGLCSAAAPGLEPVPLANPLTPAASVLRTSLLAPILTAVARNRARGSRLVALFEVGRAYLPVPGSPRPREERRAGAVLFADDPPGRWGGAVGEGFLHFKGRVESALASAGFAVEFHPAEVEPYARGLCLEISLGGVTAGHLGTLSPALLDAAGIRGGQAQYAEWSLERLSPATPRFRPFSKFPPVVRDFSFLVPAAVPWVAVRAALEGLSLEFLQGLELVDVYDGEGVPDSMRSWTFSLVFQSNDRTLTEEDIAPQARRVAGVMCDALGGVQR